MSNLRGIPSVNIINLRECYYRRSKMHEQLDRLDVKSRHIHINERYSKIKNELNVECPRADIMDDVGLGVTISHIASVKYWYENTNEPYALFCEDDVYLGVSDNWNFTFQDVLDNLPSDWEALQLIRIKNFSAGYDGSEGINFREREWNDWGCAAVFMKRDYARKLLERHITPTGYRLDLGVIQPIVENVMLYGLGKVYNFPLFKEWLFKESTDPWDTERGIKDDHYQSTDFIGKLWRENTKPLHELMNVSKLLNFPSVNYVNLFESANRNEFMQQQFVKYGFTKGTVYQTDRYEQIKGNYTVTSKGLLDWGHPGVAISFLKTIENWYASSNEEYAIFCDDDTSFESIDDWSFSWNQFMQNLPKDWECIQLIRINEWVNGGYFKYDETEIPTLRIRKRQWDDWGSSFMIKRSYAKKLLDKYKVSENAYDFSIEDPIWGYLHPLIENILFRGLGVVYSFPLLLEHQYFDSSIHPNSETRVRDTENFNPLNPHNLSYTYYSKLWKEVGKTTSIEQMMGKI